MSARAVQSRKAADFSIVCKVNSLNIALKASLNLGNQWEYRFNEIFNQIFPYCAGFRVFSEIVRDCAALTELCGPAPAHPVRRPVKEITDNRVWKGIFRIRDLTQIRYGIQENAKYLGLGIWLLPWKRDLPKFGYGMRDFFCLSVFRENRESNSGSYINYPLPDPVIFVGHHINTKLYIPYLPVY